MVIPPVLMMIGTREPVSKQAIFYRSQVVYTAAFCASGLDPKRHRLWQQTTETLLFSRASMTISSLGGIGGTFFTPIINPPEVAILGVGKSFDKLVKDKNKIISRKILPISLSYDHRIIDGAEGARFCVYLGKCLGKDFAFKLAV